MKVLVAGGLGFIGSHTVVALMEKNHEVVVVDNLYNSRIEVLNSLKEITKKEIIFYLEDVRNEKALEKIARTHKFDAIINFAGYKAVGESVSKPLMYYENNLDATIKLAKLAIKHQISKFLFSSSATVYGDNISPFMEEMELKKTTNPYGETKVISERILADTVKAHKGFSVSLLRYFNPIGAHKSGFIGELPSGIPNNLLPYITKVAKGELKELKVFGNDYDTHDGTGVRDYIHVMDLANGHVLALENMPEGLSIYNLGTGKGYSVLDIIKTFEATNNIKIPYVIAKRREGDIASAYADVSKAYKELGFKAKYDLKDMVKDAWNFEKNLK